LSDKKYMKLNRSRN